MANKIFLIDGHYILFKMYYALSKNGLTNSKGEDMSAVYGFMKHVSMLLYNHRPSHAAIVFDPVGGSFRNQMYPQYKANRGETPEAIKNAHKPISEIFASIDFPIISIPGFEADDVIGTLSKKFGNKENEVYIVTQDKDYGQLVSENVYLLKKNNNDDSMTVVKPADICDKYGINSPEEVIEILTLCGDTADNVPGVKGIGEKTAGKLIKEYGTVKNIYNHLHELKESVRQKMKDAENHISLTHDLVTIKTDIEIDITLEQLKIKEFKDFANLELLEILDRYELRYIKNYIIQNSRQGEAYWQKTQKTGMNTLFDF